MTSIHPLRELNQFLKNVIEFPDSDRNSQEVKEFITRLCTKVLEATVEQLEEFPLIDRFLFLRLARNYKPLAEAQIKVAECYKKIKKGMGVVFKGEGIPFDDEMRDACIENEGCSLVVKRFLELLPDNQPISSILFCVLLNLRYLEASSQEKLYQALYKSEEGNREEYLLLLDKCLRFPRYKYRFSCYPDSKALDLLIQEYDGGFSLLKKADFLFNDHAQDIVDSIREFKNPSRYRTYSVYDAFHEIPLKEQESVLEAAIRLERVWKKSSIKWKKDANVLNIKGSMLRGIAAIPQEHRGWIVDFLLTCQDEEFFKVLVHSWGGFKAIYIFLTYMQWVYDHKNLSAESFRQMLESLPKHFFTKHFFGSIPYSKRRLMTNFVIEKGKKEEVTKDSQPELSQLFHDLVSNNDRAAIQSLFQKIKSGEYRTSFIELFWLVRSFVDLIYSKEAVIEEAYKRKEDYKEMQNELDEWKAVLHPFYTSISFLLDPIFEDGGIPFDAHTIGKCMKSYSDSESYIFTMLNFVNLFPEMGENQTIASTLFFRVMNLNHLNASLKEKLEKALVKSGQMIGDYFLLICKYLSALALDIFPKDAYNSSHSLQKMRLSTYRTSEWSKKKPEGDCAEESQILDILLEESDGGYTLLKQAAVLSCCKYDSTIFPYVKGLKNQQSFFGIPSDVIKDVINDVIYLEGSWGKNEFERLDWNARWDIFTGIVAIPPDKRRSVIAYFDTCLKYCNLLSGNEFGEVRKFNKFIVVYLLLPSLQRLGFPYNAEHLLGELQSYLEDFWWDLYPASTQLAIAKFVIEHQKFLTLGRSFIKAIEIRRKFEGK